METEQCLLPCGALYCFLHCYYLITKRDLIKEVIFKLQLPSKIPSRFCFRISFTGTEQKPEKLEQVFYKLNFVSYQMKNPECLKRKIEFYTNSKFYSK